MKSKLLLAMLTFTLAGAAAAQMKPDDAIKFRQSGYTFMSWNMGKLKGMLVDNPASFNKDQAIAAANVIAATANSGMGALYVPGSDKGKGWKETRTVYRQGRRRQGRHGVQQGGQRTGQGGRHW